LDVEVLWSNYKGFGGRVVEGRRDAKGWRRRKSCFPWVGGGQLLRRLSVKTHSKEGRRRKKLKKIKWRVNWRRGNRVTHECTSDL